MERMRVRFPCARCGRWMTYGGHTRPGSCCRDCKDVDPEFCAQLEQT